MKDLLQMGLFANLKDWWTFRQLSKEFNKEVDENVNMWHHTDSMAEVQDDEAIQQKYHNGITLMKKRLNSMRNGQDANGFLSKNFGEDGRFDLLALAKDEDANRKALRQVRESAYVYQGADIKTEEDKTKMIDTRIGHYKALHKDIEIRQVLKEARAAWAAGDIELHKQLLAKWEEMKYGKLRNSKTRN